MANLHMNLPPMEFVPLALASQLLAPGDLGLAGSWFTHLLPCHHLTRASSLTAMLVPASAVDPPPPPRRLSTSAVNYALCPPYGLCPPGPACWVTFEGSPFSLYPSLHGYAQ